MIDSWESGESSSQTMRERMQLLYQHTKGQHGDGIWFGQLELFPEISRRDRRLS